MLENKKDMIWLENPYNLFSSPKLVPMEGMTFTEQMNAITRLIIIISLVLFLLGFKQSFLFLLLAMSFIVILYYIQKRNMEQQNKEKFTPYKRGNLSMFKDPYAKTFCDDAVDMDGVNGAFNKPNWVSENGKLSGPANPKTKIPPVVAIPSHDLNFWRANNMVVHSAINDESNTDVYRSGYQVSTQCNNPSISAPDSQEDFRLSFMPTNRDPYMRYVNNDPGSVDISCGYNPQQVKRSGLPTNLAAGCCTQNPALKQYNENIFTQTIQPGVYTRSEIIEPVNSNIGISFNQQLPRTTCRDGPRRGDIEFIEHDPNLIEPVHIRTKSYGPTESDVYDPRFSGYGTSYRSYTDDNLGQTKYYYDDVDAIRMPNYIVRSNIDNQPFADKYGPIPQGDEYGNKNTSNIHKLANDAFTESSIQQRTELQQSAMRKVNALSWQQRVAPILRGGASLR